MAYLKVLLGLFSLFAKFAPLAKFAALFSWLPGGQIVGLIGGLFGLVASFFKWALADIVDAFQAPQKLVVRTLCFILVLLFGVHQGIKWDARKVNDAKAEVAAIKKEWRLKDDEDARLAAAAKAAREKAEREAAAAPVAAPAARPAANGVRKRPAAAAKSEPSLWSGILAYPK